MQAKRIFSYARTKVWCWFKGGLDGGEWRGGFYATDNIKQERLTLFRAGKQIFMPFESGIYIMKLTHIAARGRKNNVCILVY